MNNLDKLIFEMYEDVMFSIENNLFEERLSSKESFRRAIALWKNLPQAKKEVEAKRILKAAKREGYTVKQKEILAYADKIEDYSKMKAKKSVRREKRAKKKAKRDERFEQVKASVEEKDIEDKTRIELLAIAVKKGLKTTPKMNRNELIDLLRPTKKEEESKKQEEEQNDPRKITDMIDNYFKDEDIDKLRQTYLEIIANIGKKVYTQDQIYRNLSIVNGEIFQNMFANFNKLNLDYDKRQDYKSNFENLFNYGDKNIPKINKEFSKKFIAGDIHSLNDFVKNVNFKFREGVQPAIIDFFNKIKNKEHIDIINNELNVAIVKYLSDTNNVNLRFAFEKYLKITLPNSNKQSAKFLRELTNNVSVDDFINFPKNRIKQIEKVLELSKKYDNAEFIMEGKPNRKTYISDIVSIEDDSYETYRGGNVQQYKITTKDGGFYRFIEPTFQLSEKFKQTIKKEMGINEN